MTLGGCVVIRPKVENLGFKEEAVEVGPRPDSGVIGAAHLLLSLMPLLT
jgi:hypothetical protein